MNPLNIFSVAEQGVYYAATEIPKWAGMALSNTIQGCLENPKAIPVLVTSLAMANGGFVTAYKSEKKVLSSFQNGEKTEAACYTAGAVACSMASFIGGISTMFLITSPASKWEAHDFTVLKDSARFSYDTGVFLCQNAMQLPKWGHDISKFIVEHSIKNPVPAFSCSFSVGLSVVGVVL
jgi:hypothetical protein